MEGDLELEAVNGSVSVTGKPASVEAKTVNGTVEVSATSSRVNAESVGGRILLEDVEGDVSASTVGGTIRVSGGNFDRAKFSSVSGSVEFEGNLDSKGTFEFQSHNGDIVLHLPSSVSAEFDVSTFSGDIDNDFGPTGFKRQHGPGRQVSFTTRDGDARVNISTFSGDVRLVKK